MAYTPSQVANLATRLFLQEIGAQYDRSRGRDPFDKALHLPEVRAFFDDHCCYCGEPLTSANIDQDHLVAMNRTSGGLHAWGNVVPTCKACNNAKNQTDWTVFIQNTAGREAGTRRARIEDFIAHYEYAPDIDIADTAHHLYQDIRAMVVQLVRSHVTRLYPDAAATAAPQPTKATAPRETSDGSRSAEQIVLELRTKRSASWSNLRKAARALQGLPHDAFGTPKVGATSKSIVRTMQRDTGLEFAELAVMFDVLDASA